MSGVRHVEFDDEFGVIGYGGTLGDSRWTAIAENHLVGPQVGGRWFRQVWPVDLVGGKQIRLRL